MGLKIIITSPVYPTENMKKIKNSIMSIFPDCKFKLRDDEIICESDSIERFKELLKEERIRDAARAYFMANMNDDILEFSINKQVATVGKISFSVGDVPLGDIKIRIITDSLQELIDDIAPNTKHQ